MSSFLNKGIEQLKGLGDQKKKLLNKELNIYTIEDLLWHLPFRYEDRTRVYLIKDLNFTNITICIEGTISKITFAGIGKSKRLIATLTDQTGQIDLLWFKGFSWINKIVKTGANLRVYGKVTTYNKVLNIVHPEIEYRGISEISRKILPVYGTTELLAKRFLNSKGISKLQHEAYSQSKHHIKENLPLKILVGEKLLDRAKSFYKAHFPDTIDESDRAIKRLKFEEFFYLQVRLIKEKIFKKKKTGHKIANIELFTKFFNTLLPYKFTNDQEKVIKEIYLDIISGHQMTRLIQGDVGSGKTIVALSVILMCLSNNLQATIMAPTEVLAEQHHRSLEQYLTALNIKSDILTGSTTNKQRKNILTNLELGNTSVLFGTHAIIEDRVKFKKLGIAIIDEQHKFGVMQRSKIWKKNQQVEPHVLVMTATPIPRTLAMTLYGNLDISIIREMPHGRKPIQTYWYRDTQRLRIFELIRQELQKGKQAYVVYPLIEESEKMNYKDLVDGHESIKRAFPNIEVGVLHGQMKSSDKEFEMKRFVEGHSKIMVSTTVIEVGVNVPNATIIVIESAERFGLSQLHQLRGRVGRGNDQSYCILVSGNQLSKESVERLKIMISTNDGFEISNADLKLRGPGNIMGARQSGLLNLKVADIVKDETILSKARNLAIKLLEEDPELKLQENRCVKEYIDYLSVKKDNFIGIG